jgi:hypothetical protein
LKDSVILMAEKEDSNEEIPAPFGGTFRTASGRAHVGGRDPSFGIDLRWDANAPLVGIRRART